jgi:putative membrane protein insertion efficiency factor
MTLHDFPSRFALRTIRLYQLTLSPFIGRQCRFHPTCSVYAAEAIGRFGVVRGSVLAIRRIGRCHPFHPGGFDPVPPSKES